MKVAFVNGNRETMPDAAIPLGLLYVASNTPERHAQIWIDLCFEAEPADVLKQRIREFQPAVVALGMRNIQNADYTGTRTTLEYYAELLSAIRSATGVPIVMGGSGFSVIPRELMRSLRPDYGISGEAEIGFPALLDALEGDGNVENIGNLYWWKDGELVANPPPRGFLDLNAVVAPDRSRIDARYYEHYGIESLQTKRGCPLRCDYCTYPTIEGRVGRVREPHSVVSELVSIVEERPETKHVFIVDSVFNLPRAHAKAVCSEMIARGNETPWTCYANPLGYDRELAELMAGAGCAGIEVGSDSGSDEVLERLRKGFTTKEIRALHALAEGAGIPDCHSFILGTPGETFDDTLRTLDFVADLEPFSAILMVWVDDVESVDADLAKCRQALRESILEKLAAHKDEFAWWSIPSLGVNYDPKFFDLLRSKGFEGPLWQHIRGSANAPGPRRRRRARPPQGSALT